MRNLKKVMIALVVLLLFLGIHSSLGIFKSTSNVPSAFPVASWDVDVSTNSSSSMQLLANTTDTSSYTITVTSDSEVDTNYSIIVSNIPSGVQVKLDDGSFQPYSSTVTFLNVGTILYGAQPNTATHTLTFRANTGATPVSNQQVSVDVEFKQNV